MPREDNLSSRFDYLFEPLDVEESVDDSETAGGRRNGAPTQTKSRATPHPYEWHSRRSFSHHSARSPSSQCCSFSSRTRPKVPSTVLLEPSPVPTTVTAVPSQVATVAPPPPTQAGSEAAQTVESVPTQEAVPEPPPTQTPPPRAPQGGAQNSPSTRAPISVAPESRPPFPNQGPRTGDNGGGGLLGGLL